MSLSKREKRLLVLAIIIIGGLSLVKWVIIPIWSYYDGLNMEIYEKEEQWKKDKLLLQSGEKYARKLQTVKGSLNQIESRFYKGAIREVKLKVLDNLDQNIKKSNLEIKSKSMEIKDNRDLGINKIIYRAEVEGGLFDLVDFLNSLN